ncbi:MAG: ATP phosphoribosyltransferase [Candidatus Cloacimonetes bacterium]|jgi:ATP phosphoribosyltransferase|nr:ATP phosphoribosyltransferase [Candidatus Cloacimonadota bacterium]
MVRIALPNKGRLATEARELLEQAGLALELSSDRALQASLGGEFIGLFVRAQDIPEFVADGAADLGITGHDLVVESGRTVEELLDLGFGRCRVVVAARDDSGLTGLDDVPPGARVATVFPTIARSCFEARGCDVTIVPVSGAAEIAPHLGVADMIVDITSTGSTLKVNGLREIETILESSARLIARPELLETERGGRAARELAAALESVLRAQGKRYLMANVPRPALDQVKRILPGLNGPTIIDILNGGDHVAAHAVVDASDVYRIIAELKQVGAEGILVTRIERLMP